MTQPTRSGGFTFIEVLVSILVFSMGLFGLAGMQATALHNNNDALMRSIALAQIYDMADRMRANPQGLKRGLYDAVSGGGSDPECLYKNEGCTTVEQVAATDIYEWNSRNAALLPMGTGIVTRIGAVLNIAVKWDEQRSGRPDDFQSFSLDFTP